MSSPRAPLGSQVPSSIKTTLSLTLAVIGWDVISTQMAKADAEKELANQQEIAKQLESVMKEQKDLEAKINNITGVVTNGLFALKPANVLLLSTRQGVKTLFAR